MDLLVTHVAPLDAQREETESVSLRDLIDEYANDRVAVVKLDIEGNECRAMSAITLEEGGNLLVLFEDHGRDVAHTTTRFLLIADRWSHSSKTTAMADPESERGRSSAPLRSCMTRRGEGDATTRPFRTRR
jgi:hypothetical protein